MLPTLYYKSGNNIRYWNITVENEKIIIRSGILNGKETKTIKNVTGDVLKKATTQWNGKKKLGYVENKALLRKPRIAPMGAYELTDKRVHYPAMVQPKLDGYRGLAHLTSGNQVEIKSMRMKPYQHLDHITKILAKKIKNKNIYIDGEIYLDQPINVLRSILGRDNLDEDQKKMAQQIKFIVFDMFDLNKMNMPYVERFKWLKDNFGNNKNDVIEVIECRIAKNNKNIEEAFEEYVKEGYEGIIVRNYDGKYKLGGKSVDVLKSKNVLKDKFIIVGYKEGTGSNKGTVVWELRCRKNTQKNFWAKPTGTRENRREMYKNREKYIGKEITIKYFDIDKNGCVTRNPVATMTE